MKIDLNKSLLLKIGVVAALLILGIFAFSSGGMTGLAIQNPLKDCKMVEVPYEEQEAYEALEEYQVPLKYEIVEVQSSETLHGFDVWAKSTVKVRNVDSETGMFTVQQWFKKFETESQRYSSSEYIMPGEIKVFVQEFDIDLGEKWESYHKVTPSEKTLTRTVTKYKTITRYRMEEQCE